MAYGNYDNLAYKFDAYPASFENSAAVPKTAKPHIRAIRTGGSLATNTQTSIFSLLGKCIAVFLIFAAALCFVRITLTSQAVSTMKESSSLNTQISEARSSGVSLEMEQSVLSSSAAIKQQATRLGMVAPSSVESVELAPDVVAVDDNGALSLTGTIKKVVEVQG